LKHILTIALTTILATTILACGAKHKNILETGQSQVNLRSMQSRVFDTTDRERLLKTIIATLQDLAFLIDDADMDLGTVSGTRTSEYFMRITVSVRPRGDHQNIVRANAQHNLEIVEDPEPYQAFFSALSKSLFLEAKRSLRPRKHRRWLRFLRRNRLFGFRCESNLHTSQIRCKYLICC
jgi:hypothetical protein